MLCGAGSYILEFKFQEELWGIDVTTANDFLCKTAIYRVSHFVMSGVCAGLGELS